MLGAEFQDKALLLVYNFVKSSLDPSDHPTFAIDEVYIVSFVFVLGNMKALISTTLPDGMYYEVVYDKVTGTIYLVAYKRWQQLTVRGEDIGGSASPANVGG